MATRSGWARVLGLVLAGCVGTMALAADKVMTVPVKFAKGASSARLDGAFAGYDSMHYTLGARAGQTMTVTITGSTNANFNVLPPAAVPGQATAMGSGYVGGDWTGTLPANGTYLIEVFQPRASARRGEKVSYTLSVAIHGAAAATPGTTGPSAAERAGRGQFDASGQVPCAQYKGQPMGQCAFKVARGPNGSAAVVVSLPDGRKRTIFFERGKPASADLSQADGDTTFSSTQEADLFLVRAGSERYEIVEAVVTGG